MGLLGRCRDPRYQALRGPPLLFFGLPYERGTWADTMERDFTSRRYLLMQGNRRICQPAVTFQRIFNFFLRRCVLGPGAQALLEHFCP